MGCGQTKPIKTETHRKSVTFKDPPVDFIEPDPKTIFLSTSLPTQTLENSLYPPKPPKTRRHEIIPNDDMFYLVDEHALKAPKSMETSIESLCRYLTKSAKNDMEKCRLFYRWITNNISQVFLFFKEIFHLYDTAALFQGKKKPVDAESVLKLKTSVCVGYTNLFTALCRCADITVHKISGYAKGYDYNPEIRFEYGHATSHTWNAVHVDGEWRLVECTWGAGNCDELKKFHFDYHDHFFFMDPDSFVLTHFPYDPDFNMALAWQLLEEPWSLDKFNSYIKPSMKAIEWGIDFVSHSSSVVFSNGVSVFELKSSTTNLPVLNGELYPEKGENSKTYTYAYKNGPSDYKLVVRPPTVGKYTLRILANDKEDDEAFTLVSYVIKCVSTDGLVRCFPYHWGLWGPSVKLDKFGLTYDESSCPLFMTENGEVEIKLPLKNELDCSCRLSHAENLLRESDDYVMTEINGGHLCTRARLPKEGYYKLQLMVRFDDDSYKPVLAYILGSKQTLPVIHKLPKCYRAAREFRCRLIEPLTYELHRNTKIRMRLKCPKNLSLVLKKQTLKLDKVDDVWDFLTTTPNAGEKFCISGKLQNGDSRSTYKGLYEFSII
ncbi:kyphoscoliosis peptidase-like [Saccostrea cucullata]|uniref:kyphoscoliosis peptidase-like n=1 Tax=Saccostrea cuccullata TaxID=36930 RepID=UPI002ED546FE